MDRIALMIIGAQKAGTTSLGHYLGEHPALVESHLMEFTWFTDPVAREAPIEAFMERFYPATGVSDGSPIAKLSNLYMFDDAIARLREHNPRCQVVMVVRDPVIRAYSAYTMACSDGWTQHRPDFFRDLLGKAADDELHRLFLGYGHYAERLAAVRKVFPPDQVHVFRFEDLERDPQGVCDPLFKALDLTPWVLRSKEQVHNPTRMSRSARVATWMHWLRREENPLKRMVRGIMPYTTYQRMALGLQGLNRSGRRFPPMDPSTERLLSAYYLERDLELQRVTGLDLSSWTSIRSAAAGAGT